MKNLNMAFNGSSGGIEDAAVASLLGQSAGDTSHLLPSFNLTAHEMVVLNSRFDKVRDPSIKDMSYVELEAERRNLIATNTESHGYDIYRSVQSAVLMPLQNETTFFNSVRELSPTDSSIPWYNRILTWNRSDLMKDAVNSGSSQTPGNKDKPQMDQDNMSLPFQIVHAGGIDPSTVAQSQAAGTPINTRFAQLAGMSIARLLELNALGVGTASTHYYGSLSNYGIYDDPNVITGTLHGAWDTTITPEAINTDVADMKADLVLAGYPENGPYILTVGADYAGVMDRFINPQANNLRVRDNLLTMMGIEKVIVSAYAPGAKVSLAYAGSLSLINQLDITAVPYGGYNGSQWGTQNWVFFLIMNIQHEVDFNGNFGVAIYSE